ncbi:hydroxycarboxylic acid receptor 2-like isoform X2 [Eleginops maclovinus]|uniref:hydroxycarboxylic acid receptor 2-like isoform X2 n=1 Tax=Eleginops maclovinus TaxID=56733 RepID=UPI003080B528
MQCEFNSTFLISVLPPLLMTESFLGIFGNGLALWIFCFCMKPWKSSTVLLFNLAMADFMLIVALPFRASYYFSGIKWKFGNPMCNICLFMLALNRSGSSIFLMAIAVDRYMRVVHPHHAINSLSIPKAICGALVLWLLTISLTVNIFSLQHINTTYCESFKIIRHLRRRQLSHQAKIKKALWFIVVVAVIFMFCFLPSNITQLIIWIKTQQLARHLPEAQVCQAMNNLTTVFYISISLTYLNSVLDPVVYYFSSPTFKSICRKVLHLSQTDNAESSEKKIRETGSQSLSQL